MATVDVGIRAHRAFGRSTLARNLALAAPVALLAFLTALSVEAPSDQAAAPGAILTLSVDAVHTSAVRG
jgi:hypothetical protein